MDSQLIKMENISGNVWHDKETGNKDSELEDRSWYILTILIRIGRSSLPEEISKRCTLFNISPAEVEGLCCFPQSPICMTEGHMVTFSETSIILLHNASRRFVDPLDLVVPDTPVSSSSPSRTCSKGARLYSALQSHSLKRNSHAIQDNHPISSPLFHRDANKDLTSTVHRKSSCHATTVCTSELVNNTVGAGSTCTATDMLQIVSPTCKGQSVIGIDYAEVDLSLKCSKKRFIDDLDLPNLSSRNPTKLPKVARSIFPESLRRSELLSPTEQHCLNLPRETVNSKVANGVIQDKMDIDDGDGCCYQMALDYPSACQPTIHHPKRAIAFDILDDSKPECLLDESHAKLISGDIGHLERRNSMIVNRCMKDISIKKSGIGETQNMPLTCQWPKDNFKVHNETDCHGLESYPLYSHDKFALNSETKFKLECSTSHKDDTSKIGKRTNTVDGKQSDEIKLELILNSISESTGQKHSVLPMEVVKLPESCKAEEDASAGYDKRNCTEYLKGPESINKDFEPNCFVPEISVLPAQDPDHLHMQAHEVNTRADHVMGVGSDYICFQGHSSLEDTNLVKEKEFQREPCLAPKLSEDQNTPTSQYEKITKCKDENVSINKESVTVKKKFPSKMVDSCNVNSMGTQQENLRQECKNSSSKQKTKRCEKSDKCATAGDTISCQKDAESRRLPIFKFFTVEEEEGSGGYGTVYKVRRKQDAQIFAIKCPLEKTTKTNVTNEILMLQRFGGSNFIIKLEGVVQNYTQDCLILEYVVHDKPEVLRREITISELKWYGFCMFKALSALHKQGVIHRDIKPGNFLFSRKIRRGYLIDFNLALDQFDSISSKSNVSLSLQISNKSYMAENATSCQRSGNNDRLLALRKQSRHGLQHGAGICSLSNVSAHSTKQETKRSIKPAATWCENKENLVVPLKHQMQVLPLSSSDIRSHRKFSEDISNTGLRCNLGATSYSKNIAGRWQQSGAEATREPLPTQGRKELLNLLQAARQNSQKPVCTDNQVPAPQGRLKKDVENKMNILPLPLNSNSQACLHGLSDLPKKTGMQKCKRDGPCVGTKGYRAPEVLLRSLHQGPKLDIWSAGVTLLNFMVGKSPFPTSSADQAIKDIAKMRGVEEILELSKLHDREHSLPQGLHSVRFEPMAIKEWCEENTKRPEFLECIPWSLYDLVDKCLCVNPRLRIDADKALMHEFFAPCHEECKKQTASKDLFSL